MNFKIKKLFSLLLATAIVLGTSVVAFAENSQVAGHITFAVERFTIGEGYFVEPKTVAFYEGDSYASVLAREVGEENLEFSGTVADGFYLTGIKNADTSTPLIPSYLQEGLTAQGITVSDNEDTHLSSGDYTGDYSCWMYFVNNKAPFDGMSAIIPNDGDVFRLQYSLYWGLDLGDDMGGYMTPLCYMANKDELTKLYASIKENDYADIKDVVVNNEQVNSTFGTIYGENLTVAQWIENMPNVLTQPVEDNIATDENLNALKNAIADTRLIQKKYDVNLNLDSSIDLTSEFSLTNSKGENIDLGIDIINSDSSKSYQLNIPADIYSYSVKDENQEIGKGTFVVTADEDITLSKWTVTSNNGWVAVKDYNLLIENSNEKIEPTQINNEFVCVGQKNKEWTFTVTPSDEMLEKGYVKTVYNTNVTDEKISLICEKSAQETTKDLSLKTLEETIKYVKSTFTNPQVSQSGGEWTVISLLRNSDVDAKDYFNIYYKNLSELLKENEGILSATKHTEYSRVILTLRANGFSPEDVEGFDLLKPLSDYDATIKQGISGGVYALLALNAVEEEKPELEKQYVDYILEKQLENGGFAFFGTNVDLDITAMVLQALAPYYNTNEEVKTAVDKALEASQTAYKETADDKLSAESVAQFIIALTSLGIDPNSQTYFDRDGESLVSTLLKSALDDGTFSHLFTNPKSNIMATEQCLMALVSYNRFVNNESAFFAMRDVKVDTEEETTTPETTTPETTKPDTVPDTSDTNTQSIALVILTLSALAFVSFGFKKSK